MASSSLLTTATSPTPTTRATILAASAANSTGTPPTSLPTRRQIAISLAGMAASSTASLLLPLHPALAENDEEYVRDTNEVIAKLRTTISIPKTDPNLAAAVADLRESSNTWVAKFRKERTLLGRSSFRDIYSALNAVSGHYVSFGPTAPIPAKRKARILEELESAEKALLRGR